MTMEAQKRQAINKALNVIHEELTSLTKGQLSAKDADSLATWVVGLALGGIQPSLTLNNFQQQAVSTAFYPGRGQLESYLGLSYVTMGLAGEAGEILNKTKKILRDQDSQITAANRATLIMELGDVLWYAAALASQLGSDLETVAQLNLDKLQRRKEADTLKGSGDDR